MKTIEKHKKILLTLLFSALFFIGSALLVLPRVRAEALPEKSRTHMTVSH